MKEKLDTEYVELIGGKLDGQRMIVARGTTDLFVCENDEDLKHLEKYVKKGEFIPEEVKDKYKVHFYKRDRNSLKMRLER